MAVFIPPTLFGTKPMNIPSQITDSAGNFKATVTAPNEEGIISTIASFSGTKSFYPSVSLPSGINVRVTTKLYNSKDTSYSLKEYEREMASMAIGAGIARHRAGAAMDQERQGYESQLDQSQRQIEAQQRQLEALQGQTQQKPRRKIQLKSWKNMLISDKKGY
jgi:Tfp pilus assembly protein FimV